MYIHIYITLHCLTSNYMIVPKTGTSKILRVQLVLFHGTTRCPREYSGTKWPWMFRHSTSKMDFCRMPDQPGGDATFEMREGLPNHLAIVKVSQPKKEREDLHSRKTAVFQMTTYQTLSFRGCYVFNGRIDSQLPTISHMLGL